MTTNALQLGPAQPPAEPAPPPPTYVEYPLVMVHPNARKATCDGVPGQEKRDPRTGQIIPGEFWQYRGSPDFMPPVTVNNADQEAYHASEGYRRGGKGDVAAFANLQCGASVKPHVVERYPMWVGSTLVHNEAEEKALRGVSEGQEDTSRESASTTHNEEDAPVVKEVKPRHTLSAVKPPNKPRTKRQGWSPERRAAHEAAKAQSSA